MSGRFREFLLDLRNVLLGVHLVIALVKGFPKVIFDHPPH